MTVLSNGNLETKKFSLPAVIFGTTSPPKWGETYSDLELFGGELDGDMLIGVHLCLLVGLHIGGSKSSDRFSVAQAMALFDVHTTPTTSTNTEKPIRWDGKRAVSAMKKPKTTRGVFVHGTKWLLSDRTRDTGNGTTQVSYTHTHSRTHTLTNWNAYGNGRSGAGATRASTKQKWRWTEYFGRGTISMKTYLNNCSFDPVWPTRTLAIDTRNCCRTLYGRDQLRSLMEER